jgi:hypothetical protein
MYIDFVDLKTMNRDCYYFFTLVSKNSFASLIFKAKKGEPPRSGWLSNMIRLCASLIFCLVA